MSLVIGTWSGWSGVMPIILQPLGISQVILFKNFTDKNVDLKTLEITIEFLN